VEHVQAAEEGRAGDDVVERDTGSAGAAMVGEHGEADQDCDRTTSGGVRRQDQLEQFSVKREHNQHTIVQYHIIHSSRSYYNIGSRISYTKKVEAKITLQRLIRVCGSDFSHSQDIPFCCKTECHPSAF
jgi:hypothetical protein